MEIFLKLKKLSVINGIFWHLFFKTSCAHFFLAAIELFSTYQSLFKFFNYLATLHVDGKIC